MKEILYSLFLSKGKPLSKTDLGKNKVVTYYKLIKDGFNLVDLNREFKIRSYNESPKFCITCNEKLEYCSDIKVKKYCNSSCSSKTNNQTRTLKLGSTTKEYTNCIVCDVKLTTQFKYCSHLCSSNSVKEKNIKDWLEGRHKGHTGKTKQICPFVRTYLQSINGSACSQCGWDEKHPDDGKVLTEVDHIDGNADNCHISNLRILCPNCHSMTSTFRARNPVSSRNRKIKTQI